MSKRIAFSFAILALILTSCAQTESVNSEIKVIAAEGFLADIAQNIAGDRLTIQSLLPLGTDAHTYQPTPKDIAAITNSDLFIINGHGMEIWLDSSIDNADGAINIIEASEGLTPRELDRSHNQEGSVGEQTPESKKPNETDPHFWLDPINIMTYADNIAVALAKIDPSGEDIYAANAEAYKAQLTELDGWIIEQVSQIPSEKRQIITNHESLGYFADRYGFKVVATILEGSSTDSAISSGHMVELIELINTQEISTIFLSREEDSTLALQLADETGIAVNYDLISHSLTETGETSTYISMMRHNVQVLMTLR